MREHDTTAVPGGVEVDTHAVPRSDCFNPGLKISIQIARLHLGTRLAVATNVFSLFTGKRQVSLSNKMI